MSPTETDSGYTKTSRDPHQAVAKSEANASVHLRRNRASMYRGLCSNCDKLDTCSYPSAINDTWYCEEYSVQSAPKQSATPKELFVIDAVPDTHMGLCLNCNLRETCKLPKPAGGVWFCNEYE
jgi:hypothetical protein